ncbi:trifunctional transcriptional regulator/proline dehydrogenase/L-glutamate gamma-semialdehyde dehydrogenase [Paraburkholderia silviterrae]|uniref:Bifunctional protein PutA n=1 Tax=Paraburkholderia silviterrae TaxID=2528715 RepID=A0A4R5MB22_9BURK|nr:trifunctional transcriptional regulator/proline dehydrogenase/L-glutamate gamma-semialdehyde dehydrogenase [Paraburkholderia silviterrae]TDG23960.1 trifunctional transcriptional regulator/proline dehydrogenase/L-glutamate gamma-semialdehyde dehydrogenase [Paraburkholderia silviterrae]
MASTTLGVKVDDLLRSRLKDAATRLERTPHWLIKQAIFAYLEKIEHGQLPPELNGHVGAADLGEGATGESDEEAASHPFLEFAQNVQPQSVLRAAITAAYRRPEPECVPFLIGEARLPASLTGDVTKLATKLVEALRAKGTGGGVEGLIHEFSLSSQEGVALMCLAEALLRIPDRATRDALIRDKISKGDWKSHVGHAPSLFVNAATWGLMITGKLVTTNSETGLSSALTRMIGKGGEPLIRKGVDMAMRLMGEQFVTGENISEALANSRKFEARGFRYSYDMLGEAATTEADAQRYYASYEQAIHAIGKAAGGRGIYEGPGISIKLSALHPRYSRAQQERTMSELLPRVRALAVLARRYDIGLNIDAEEADRLELSLDLLEALCFDPELQGWNGIGFVVQAYQKRCPFVIDYIVDLARRSRHRIMVRLVKGAYWDTEIKRAQVDGLEGYPVYTRKIYTDVSYIACAKRLLGAPDAVYPQFATHNAYTLSAIYHLAGQNYYPGQYEFQCLHGMGEPLYEEVTGPVSQGKLNRPCRVYAPVGTHETLLAYLVRRLLENGANTSFVNRIADETVPVSELVANPIDEAAKVVPTGAPHAKIPLPRNLYGGERQNSMGLDLSNEHRLASLSSALLASAHHPWRAAPMLADVDLAVGTARDVRNPADNRDLVGTVVEATSEHVSAALSHAVATAPIWQATPVEARADCLARAADLLEAQMHTLMGLIVREAGKSLPNAVAEIREAIDFLRYYSTQIREEFSNDTHRPLGPVVCISPWNFPLAIFMGQVAAALAAGNTVLAKPAEQTPLIAAQAVRILREAGVPAGAVQLLPGDGETVGAALVADARTRAVMFTGSTEVARLINKTLSQRLDSDGRPIPLIAETGGQNAMIVDSSALAEQVVADVLQSAFDSAGQRCSALRVLCLQEDVAERTLEMLTGAMKELAVGNPDRLSADVGPVIDTEAKRGIDTHIGAMREKGRKVTQMPTPDSCAQGTFVPPTLIEIDSLDELKREVFGPVLHVIRYRRSQLDKLLEQIRATGYGLTLGIHTRIDETIAHVVGRAHVGNIYVNRNVIGAVVGVQPFGGEGLSGTGPKAGGALYLSRLLAKRPAGLPLSLSKALVVDAPQEEAADKRAPLSTPQSAHSTLTTLRDWLIAEREPALAARCDGYLQYVLAGATAVLPGPTGERNTYTLSARGTVLCVASTPTGARAQLAVVLATGNRALFQGAAGEALVNALPAALKAHVAVKKSADAEFDAVLFEGDSDELLGLVKEVAKRGGPIVSVQGVAAHALANGDEDYALERLLTERSVSVNTAAAGGNANLMTIG